MTVPEIIDLTAALDQLSFLPDRAPGTAPSVSDWAVTAAPYRDGGIFVVHWAGESEWERHPAEEIVMIVDGSTTMTLIIDDVEHQKTLGPMQLIVVPEMTWHRFVTPVGVRVVAVSPQPTEHQVDRP